jgi:hypothetical protein
MWHQPQAKGVLPRLQIPCLPVAVMIMAEYGANRPSVLGPVMEHSFLFFRRLPTHPSPRQVQFPSEKCPMVRVSYLDHRMNSITWRIHPLLMEPRTDEVNLQICSGLPAWSNRCSPRSLLKTHTRLIRARRIPGSGVGLERAA